MLDDNTIEFLTKLRDSLNTFLEEGKICNEVYETLFTEGMIYRFRMLESIDNYQFSRKIFLIKELRECFQNLGLKDAKDASEAKHVIEQFATHKNIKAFKSILSKNNIPETIYEIVKVK